MNWTNEVFVPKYKDKLNSIPERNRGDGFQVMFETLEKKDKHLISILETGSMRPGYSVEGDGQSTKLFDEFVNARRGMVISVDIDQQTSKYARDNTSEKSYIYTDDSVHFLWKNRNSSLLNSTTIDLFYLDSYDVDFQNPLAANLHHMKELVAISEWLDPGVLVAVDDCRFYPGDSRIPPHIDPRFVGKGVFVEDFMENIGAKLLFNGYQKVWEIVK